jgi:hypothetical protein
MAAATERDAMTARSASAPSCRPARLGKGRPPAPRPPREPLTDALWVGENAGMRYLCRHCGTRVEQTDAAWLQICEIRETTSRWVRRVLCQSCFLIRCSMEKAVNAYRLKWQHERVWMRTQPHLLRHWADLLETLPQYGAPKDESNLHMLRRLAPPEGEPPAQRRPSLA